MRTWTTQEFEIEYAINLGEEAECVTPQANYYRLADGRSLEIVTGSGVVKIDESVVGRITD